MAKSPKGGRGNRGSKGNKKGELSAMEKLIGETLGPKVQAWTSGERTPEEEARSARDVEHNNQLHVLTALLDTIGDPELAAQLWPATIGTASFARLPLRLAPAATLFVKLPTSGELDVIPLYPGLYVLSGPAGSGKTYRGLTLARSFSGIRIRSGTRYSKSTGEAIPEATMEDHKKSIAPSCYYGMLEPRVDGTLNDLVVSRQTVSVTQGTQIEFAEAWDARTVLTLLLEKVAKEAGSRGSRAVVVDSLTNVVPFVGSALMGNMDDATLSGGLRRSEIMGTLLLNAMAAEAGVALIGTFNDELFPRVDVLEGVAEGRIILRGPDSFDIRDRADRTWRTYGYSPLAEAAAQLDMNWATASRSSTFSSFNLNRI